MKHLIMCTSGHVDHGKTTLIKALTGIDCDTHPEERARGITINPGFAYLDLPQESPVEKLRIGIVDVPGHRRFIHNMLAGASGVDFALLVVAADDGVMPQTIEHLAILEHLGVRDGLVALTKADLAGGDLVVMAVDEVREALAKSFLRSAEIIPVSAVTGSGLSELQSAIGRVVTRLPERAADDRFRLFIDRVFSVAGFGTVVTGSVMGGRVHVGDTLRLLPKGQELRVRRIEHHGAEVQGVSAGERASLNLADIKRETIERGMLLADRWIEPSSLVDVELALIDGAPEMKLYHRALFYCGTQERLCRVHLIDCDRLHAGQKALAQIELENPAVLIADDRFILRSCSADRTLGGGRVIDPAPLHHRRRSADLLQQMRQRAEGGLAEQVAAEVQKHITLVSLAQVADVLNRPKEEIEAALSAEEPDLDLIVLGTAAGMALLSTDTEERLWRKVRRALVEYHHQHPLSAKGIDAGGMAARLGVASSGDAIPFTEGLLQRMAEAGKIVRSQKGGYLLAGFVPKSTPNQQAALASLRKRFSEAGMSVLPLSELEAEAGARFAQSGKDLKMLLRHLVDEGFLLPVEEVYLLKETVDCCRQAILGYLASHPEGITVAQFRDLVSGNRRICLLLLGLYDREGVTRREGDLRFLGIKA